ncbi:GNAT family N-acetyltransferase [Cucumibacter marinus]|uniref:GNAT family N-acetyltransferase n=1 Tax=Cucumibacter marinus TaxID=1121252 RepID=UPI00041CF583|nr:GNAT family N-acetyltransferase [Cucumibacter marinus]
MAIKIAVETPLQDEVRDMVAALNDYLRPLSPIEFQFQMTAEEMAGPGTIVFVARDETGEAVGMGSLKIHDHGLGEVKRMYTHESARGRRVGAQLVERIILEARNKRLSRLVLETGVGEGFEPAHRLYARRGFSLCGPVLDYPDSGYSTFFEMAI